MENVDWESCSKSGGDLRCPVDNFQSNAIDVYNKFLEAVKEFHNLNALPIDVKFEGENLGECFVNTELNGINHAILNLLHLKWKELSNKEGKSMSVMIRENQSENWIVV